MRLFRVENDKVVEEVETTERLAGAYDGAHVAQRTGDGEYDLDFGDGNVLRINVVNGQAQQLGQDAMRTVNLDDRPHKEWDRQQVAEQTRSGVSRFGGLFPDEDAPPPARESEPAVEQF